MILAVVSRKGGVGESTSPFELTVEPRSVIVDAGLGMANLLYAPDPDPHDVLTGRASPLEAVHSGGPVSILPCRRTLVDARAVDTCLLADAFHAVEAAYGDVIADCPAGMHAGTGVSLAIAGARVVVASPKSCVPADAVRTRELVYELGCGLAVVAVDHVVDAMSLDAFAGVFGMPATGIPVGSWLAEVIERFEPVIVSPSESLPSARIRGPADAVRVSGRQKCRLVFDSFTGQRFGPGVVVIAGQ